MLKRPQKLRLHRTSNRLEIIYTDQKFDLSAEFLRVHSPSAEVRGHGKPQLQYGKKNTGISAIDNIGHYGIKITFSDGHDTGIFTWEYLFQLCQDKEKLWEIYLNAIQEAQLPREPNATVVQIK